MSDEAAIAALPPIIDTHQHLWDVDRFTLHWHASPGTESLRRSFLTPDYQLATEGLPIRKTVYMEVDVAPEQQSDEADFVLNLCACPDDPMAAAVISGRPGTPSFEPYVRKYAKFDAIKGIRQVLHGGSTPAGFCLTPQFVKSMQLLGDLGLSYDLCMRAAEMPDAAKLVRQCPGTRFIVDHCGNMSVTSTDQDERSKWEAGMKELAQLPNVVCKISGIVASAQPDWKPADLAPNVNFSLDTFGEDRVMFAGDWPVCTLRATFRQWVLALSEITKDRSATFRNKLFQLNAEKFYRLA